MTGTRFVVEVTGSGRVELPAYGLADAEHRVEKELRRLWPEATVRVLEVGSAGPGRIVDEYAVRYRVSGRAEADAEARPEAARAVLRELRTRFRESRYERIAWELVEDAPEGRSG